MKLIRFQTPSLPLTRFHALQHDLDCLFDLSLGRSAARPAGWTPVLDVHQDAENLLVHVEMPGMKREDVTLSLHDGVLTLCGERRQPAAGEASSTVRNERCFGRFERSVTLPAPVDATRVSAAYENGILTVTLPKTEAAKPRQIEISVK